MCSGACEGLRYVEGALPDNAGVASLLDQLALVQFLLDRLPEAEASAQRMVELAAHMFVGDTAARAMCSLRLGAVLAGELLSQRSIMHEQSLSCLGSEGSRVNCGHPWTKLPPSSCVVAMLHVCIQCQRAAVCSRD